MAPPILQKYPCDLCGYKTAHKSFLHNHINRVHLGVKPHKCETCDFATAHYNSLAAHKKRPHLRCEQCPFVAVGKGGAEQSSTANKEMRRHEERNHGIFRSESSIIMDTNVSASGTEPVASNGLDEDINTTEEEVPKESASLDAVTESNSEASSIQEELCDDSKNPALKEEIDIPDKTTNAKDNQIAKRFPCDLCGYTANRKEWLVAHVNGVHLKVKPFKCDTCNFATTHKRSLAYHKMKPHLTCEQCPFITVGNSQMKFHMSRHQKSSIDPELKCLDCSFTCKSASELVDHARDIHKKEKTVITQYVTPPGINSGTALAKATRCIKNYPCNLCGFTADRNILLADHVNSVHLGIKPYKCDNCDFVTGHSASLTLHNMMPHLTCEQCPFITVSNSKMNSHMKRHQGNSKGEPSKIENTDGITSPDTAVASSPSFEKDLITTEEEVAVGTALLNVDAKSDSKAEAPANKEQLIEGSMNSDLKKTVRIGDVTHQVNNSEKALAKLERSRKKFSCNLCGFITDRNIILTDHVNSVHLGIKPYKCDACDYVTGRSATLAQHKKRYCKMNQNFSKSESSTKVNTDVAAPDMALAISCNYTSDAKAMEEDITGEIDFLDVEAESDSLSQEKKNPSNATMYAEDSISTINDTGNPLAAAQEFYEYLKTIQEEVPTEIEGIISKAENHFDALTEQEELCNIDNANSKEVEASAMEGKKTNAIKYQQSELDDSSSEEQMDLILEVEEEEAAPHPEEKDPDLMEQESLESSSVNKSSEELVDLTLDVVKDGASLAHNDTEMKDQDLMELEYPSVDKSSEELADLTLDVDEEETSLKPEEKDPDLECIECNFASKSVKEMMAHALEHHSIAIAERDDEVEFIQEEYHMANGDEEVMVASVKAGRETNTTTPPEPESDHDYPYKENDRSTVAGSSQDDHSIQLNDVSDLNKKRATTNSPNTGKTDQDLKCLDCSFVCQSAWELVDHAVDSHKKEKPIEQVKGPKLECLRKKSIKERKQVHGFRCSDCHYYCRKSTSLSQHALNVHKKVLDFNKVRKVKRREMKNQELKCLDCSFLCTSASELVGHACDIHNKISENVKKIVRPEHDTPTVNRTEAARSNFRKRFPCDLCEYSGSRKIFLNEHVNTVHLRMKQYKCDTCEFVTGHSSSLINHKNGCPIEVPKSDTKRKRYSFGCSDCRYKCKTIISLSKHALNVHQTVLDLNKMRKVKRRRQMKSPELRCLDCSFKTESATELLDHARDVHKRDTSLKTEKIARREDAKSTVNNNEKTLKNIPHSLTRFPCDLCGQKYKYMYLNEHVNSVHLGIKPYKCDSCDFVAGQAPNLAHHKKRVHSKKPQAPGEIEHSRKRKRPNIRKQPSKDSELKCFECSFTCKDASELVDHARNIHGKEKTVIAEDVKTPVINSEKALAKATQCMKKFLCSLCGFTTDRKIMFIDHVNSVHLGIKPYKCDACDYVTGQSACLAHHKKRKCTKRDRGERKLKLKSTIKCADCDFTSRGNRKLSQHALDVHQKVLNINPNPKRAQKQRSGCGRAKDYLCDSCPYSTAYKFNLTKHVNALHSKEKLYQCHLCDYSSLHSTTLKLHKESKHCQDQSVECSLCTHISKDKRNLNIHYERIHDNVKVDMQCKECDFEANYMKQLVLHIREAHHETTQVFNCNVCEFSAYHELALREHADTNHKEWKCYNCDFVGSSKVALTKHMKAQHRDQQMHKCDLCLFSSDFGRNLRTHLKINHGGVEVDLRCKDCDFEGADLKLIEEHAKEAHSKEYSCEKCQFSTHHEPTLVAHVGSTHGQCQLCDFVGKSPGHLRRHMETKHQIIDPELEDQPKFRCGLCVFTTKLKGYIDHHWERVHNNAKAGTVLLKSPFKCF